MKCTSILFIPFISLSFIVLSLLYGICLVPSFDMLSFTEKTESKNECCHFLKLRVVFEFFLAGGFLIKSSKWRTEVNIKNIFPQSFGWSKNQPWVSTLVFIFLSVKILREKGCKQLLVGHVFLKETIWKFDIKLRPSIII